MNETIQCFRCTMTLHCGKPNNPGGETSRCPDCKRRFWHLYSFSPKVAQAGIWPRDFGEWGVEE